MTKGIKSAKHLTARVVAQMIAESRGAPALHSSTLTRDDERIIEEHAVKIAGSWGNQEALAYESTSDVVLAESMDPLRVRKDTKLIANDLSSRVTDALSFLKMLNDELADRSIGLAMEHSTRALT